MEQHLISVNLQCVDVFVWFCFVFNIMMRLGCIHTTMRERERWDYEHLTFSWMGIYIYI